MRKRVHVIPLDQLADPPPLWRRMYFLLQIRARLIPIKVIFAGLFILTFLANIYVIVNVGNVAGGASLAEFGMLLGLSLLFPWTLLIPAYFMNTDRAYVLSCLQGIFGAGCGGMLLATFLFG